MEKPLSGKEKLPESVQLVETENANYRVILSDHTIENTKEEVGKDASALLLELTLTESHVADLVSTFKELEDEDAPYRTIAKMESIKEIYFADIIADIEHLETINEELSDLATEEGIIKLLMTVSGGSLLLSKVFTRRNFLKMLGVGSGLLGLYHVPDFIKSELLYKGHNFEALSEFEKRRLLFTIYFRNLIMAHKAEYIAKKIKERDGKKPILPYSIGRLHVLVSNYMKETGEERLKKIDATLETLKNILSPKTYYSIIENIPLIPFKKLEGARWIYGTENFLTGETVILKRD